MAEQRPILLYSMNFAPELTGVGRYSGELATWLGRNGRPVEVVTTPPHYPGWFVRKPFRRWWYQRAEAGAVGISRAPILMSRRASGPLRLLAPISFAISSAPVALWRALRTRPGTLICVEPTLFAAPVGLIAAWLTGARTILHVQDLEVDAALAVGHVRLPAFIERVAFAIERGVLRRFDRIVTISDKMRDALIAKGVDPERTTVLRNWVDTTAIRPLDGPNPYRDELGLPHDAFVVLYSGQIGRKQSLDLLLNAAEALRDDPRVRFVIAGEGPLKASFELRYGHLPNLQFLPLQPEERLSDFLSLADLHVLPQDPAVAELVLPSKLGGMLASGRPILVTADIHGELSHFLGDRAHFCAPAELVAAIRVRAADAIAHDPAPQRALAETISAEAVLTRFEALLA